MGLQGSEHTDSQLPERKESYSIRLLLEDPPPLVWGPGQPRPTPPHIRTTFLRQKMKLIEGAGKFEANFRYTNCLFGP